MNTFKAVFEHYNWNEIQTKIYQSTTIDVERVLAKS